MELVSRSASAWRYTAAAISGVLFAFVVAQALGLEARFAVTFAAGVLLLSAAMTVFGRIRDLLLYVLAFNLSFTSIEKTFFVSAESTYVISGIPIGLAEICLFALYALWLHRILVEKSEPLPRLSRLDWWVLAFWAVHVTSMFEATSRTLAIMEIVRLGKYALMYFYLSHNLRRRHLQWIALAVFFAILVQSSLAVVQYRTGSLLGIGRTKGASDLDYEQYTVTNFEEVLRAEGTTFDSHALGLYMAMLLPVSLVVALTPGVQKWFRIAGWAVFVLGVPGLVASFTRAGWLAFVGAALMLLLCLLRYQYRASLRRILQAIAVAVVMACIALLPLASKIRQRLFEAPPELVTARFETMEMAWDMWKDRFWTGAGTNNYMVTLENQFSIFEGDPYYIPVHNMFLLVATELGLIGLVVFLCAGTVAVLHFWKVLRSADPLIQSLAAAVLAALVAVFIEGLFDPIYLTTVTYFTLWFLLGLGAGLSKIASKTFA